MIGNGVNSTIRSRLLTTLLLVTIRRWRVVLVLRAVRRLGDAAPLAGAGMIVGHLEIADDVHISAGTMVTKSLRKAGQYCKHLPARSAR